MKIGDAVLICESCLYWFSIGRLNGECRRHAPVVLNKSRGSELDVHTYWPKTTDNAYCGDWHRKWKEENDNPPRSAEKAKP